MKPAQEILEASQHGDVAKVRWLLSADPTLVHSKGAYDKTLLHWAAEKNNRELAELLKPALR